MTVPYAWIIDKDYSPDPNAPEGTNSNAKGVSGPHNCDPEALRLLEASTRVLASKSALVRAAQLSPDLAAEYAALEVKIGHRFRVDLSMAEIITEAARTEVTPIEGWAA